ncbi:MAG: polyprenyl synthetase family protein, partial [Planctomycetota bacterium]
AHRTIAAVVEMVHMATLVHDDVLDEQDVRRKGATISHLRGNEAAVMLGDYLISHAYHLCSSLDSQSAARRIAHTTNTLCEGELLQLANRNNWSLDEKTYFDIVDRKTASLCGVACALGAEFAGSDAATRDALESYGRSVGIAFQVVDDVLDLTGDPEVVGKSLGKDLEKGKLTLPLIHRLETAAPADRQKLLDQLRNGSEDQFTRVIQLLAESDSVAYAQDRAQRLIDDAIKSLGALPDSPAKDLLITLAQMVTARDA